MQSPWGNVAHNGGQDGQPAEPLWPEPYGFGPQTDQFDNVSTWAQQPIQGQMVYQEIGQNSTPPPVQFFHPPQGGPLAGISDQNNQHNFHLNHHQHHAAPDQSISSEDYDMADAYDPSKFDFGHQVSDLASQPQSQATPHLRDHQGQHHALYGFIGQEAQQHQHQQHQQQQQPAFDHRTMAHFMSRQPLTPMGQSYSDDQDQTFATGSAPQQRHQQGQPGQQQQQQQQDTSPSFAGTAVYHHQPAGYHPGLALQYGQDPRQQQHLGLHPQQPVAQIQHPQPRVSSQPATPQPPHPSQFPQLPLSSQISSQVLAQQTQQARISPVPLPGQVVDPQNGRGAVHHSPNLPSHVVSHVSDSTPTNTLPSVGSGQDPTAEPAAKKRRKAATATKKPAPVDTSIVSTPERVNSPAGAASLTVVASAPKTPDGLDILPPPPTPTNEEQDLMTRFARRKPAEKAKFPAIKGLPHLIAAATTKLSMTKSYDRLAHPVAMPSRSRKPMVPEFGCDLPCEIQGRFASSYKPVLDAAATRPRVEQRKAEADALLQHYENDMKKLGRRRPKYTEYPVSFKDQLKADEAIKMKAERRARKEKESKPIRPITRPTDYIEAAVWEILGVVHLDSAAAADSSTRNGPFIAQAVQRAGDIIVRLRGELNRAKQRHDQAVKDEESDDEIGDARQEMEKKAEAFFRAMDACLEYADDGILENLGGHQKLILALVNTLIACIKVHDFNGKMVKVVLELIGSFSLTGKSLSNTNYTAVRQRLMDKGDDEVRQFLREISAHIKKGSLSGSGSANPGTAAAAAAATGNALAPSIKSIKSTLKSSSSSSAASSTADNSAKRSRDDDGETRTVKKIAVESNSLSKKMGPQKYALTSASKITQAKTSTAAATAAAGMAARQIRPLVKAIPKPDTDPIPVNISQAFPIFPTSDGDAKSEAKTESKTEPPRRSAMTKMDAAKPTPARPLEAARVTTSRSPPPASTGALSGIASILDSINAPRSETAQARDSRPASGTTETTEERERRLRREARRHLRVMWKPDGELEQVRIFSKDAHENEGRATNMIRDAADDKSEGMVLKQRASMIDEDDDDDDEDDDIPYQPWMAPTSADFAAIPEHVRAKNFVTRAGAVTFSTGEQRYMAEREQRELMAVYTDPADIPPTPRSPPAESGDPAIEGKIVPLADKYEEIHRRWSDAEKLGSDAAAYYAIQRLDAAAVAAASGSSANTIPSLANGAVRVVLPAGPIEEQVLYLLNRPHIRNWKDIPQSIPQPLPSSDDAVQAARDAFTASMQRMARKTFPATQPPEWLTDTELIREWWMGLNRDMATKAKREAEEAVRAAAEQEAAALQQQAQQAQTVPPEWAAYYAQQQYLAVLSQRQGQAQHPDGGVGAPQQQPGGDNTQLQAILAQMGQAQAQQALSQPQSQSQLQSPSPALMNLNPNDPTYAQLILLQQMAQQQQQQPASDRGRDWERDRDGDRDRDRDGDWEMNNGRDGRDPRDGSREGRERDRDGRGDNSRKGGGGTTKKVTLPPHKPANSALIGTKPCTFWRQGKCARGESCTFRHD